MTDIIYKLESWGAWAAAESNGVDWQPIAAGFKGLIPCNSKPRSHCDDDLGIKIDGCVARLKKLKPEEYELVISHFVFRVSLRSIAKRRGCSDGTIRKELQTALGFIEGLLSLIE